VAGKLASQTQPGRDGFQVSERQHVIATARPWMAAIALSAALSLLFIIIYGGCNTLAARWADPGGWFFTWELQIPFVPTLIVPYMSIDLFFVLSPLLCEEVIELRTLARRITAAILVAGLMFITFPLTTGYARPEVSGWTGWLFEFLWSFDKPHNLVPSLHVALASLLWPVYARHTRGWLQKFIHLWFTLIVASALFTYQHHLLDMATGAMLGQVCIFAFPERREPALVQSASANLRVALLYALGAALLAVLAIALGFWFWILLWPAVSLALVALAYLRGNSVIFRKAGGRLPASTRVVLGPYLCGTFIRRLVYNRRRPPWVEIAPGVYCGRLLTNHEAIRLGAMGITSVLDMTAEHAEAKAFLDIEYLNIPVLDLTSPSREQLDVAVAFINEQVHRGGVYVHCALGISRSAAATAAYLAFRQTESRGVLA
jgi:membrane-associated phospholipid phosphatase